MSKKIPSISIIIPMYNAEKYIDACLDSILVQTFQDFEIILVDDGSTDNSCVIVESYLPKFGDKLNLIKTKHSGSSGTARNVGIRLSRGEYIYFVDSDDGILPETLEVMHDYAKKYDVEFVHTDKVFKVLDENFTTDKNALEASAFMDIDNPILLSGDLLKRINLLRYMHLESWSNFFQRDFLMRNNIHFPHLFCTDDVVFFLKSVFSAQKILLIPESLYIWRVRKDSLYHIDNVSIAKFIHMRIGDTLLGIEALENALNDCEIFTDNPDAKYRLFDFYCSIFWMKILEVLGENPINDTDPLIRLELEKVKDKTALTAFLYSLMNIFNAQLINCRNDLQKSLDKIKNKNLEIQKLMETIQTQAAKIKQLESLR